MKKYFFCSIAALILALPGCKPLKSDLTGLWVYSYNVSTHIADEVKIAATSFIYLKADGKYTRDFGYFEYGRWQQQDSLLTLTGTQNRINCIIKEHDRKELQLSINGGATIAFEKLPGKFDDEALNPFSVVNNQWRIPANKKETDQQLKARLKNHCRFYEIYFKWALDNKLQTLDVRNTPSLIKIYGNGFELKPFTQLPEVWISYFYDEEDCRKANDIMEDIFKQKDIAWGNTDNRYKMFLSAFQQLQQLIK